MQKIVFYCRKCRKSMKMAYCLTGNINDSAMNGIVIRCHTHKCTRVVTLRNFTEKKISEGADSYGRYYL
jgi:hypothetical protein